MVDKPLQPSKLIQDIVLREPEHANNKKLSTDKITSATRGHPWGKNHVRPCNMATSVWWKTAMDYIEQNATSCKPFRAAGQNWWKVEKKLKPRLKALEHFQIVFTGILLECRQNFLKTWVDRKIKHQMVSTCHGNQTGNCNRFRIKVQDKKLGNGKQNATVLEQHPTEVNSKISVDR